MKKYQIFVSSTYEDLVKEREVVIRSILEMGHIPVGMEMFSAADEEQWQIIQRQIIDCDYYVVILANSYGSIDMGISYTEKEYDYAISKKIPTLGFILARTASWPTDRNDTDTIKIEKLSNLKEKVKTKLVNFWTNKEDLYAKVSIALMKQFSTNPRTGWVRADEALNPLITQEISRLSSENSRLRKELDVFRSQEQQEEESRIDDTISLLRSSKAQLFYFYVGGKDWEEGKEISLELFFNLIAPEILTEASSDHLNGLVALMTKKTKGKLREDNPLPTNQFNSLLGDLQAMHLIEPSKIKHSVKDTNDYWTISDYGKEVHRQIRIRSIKRKIEEKEEIRRVEEEE